MVPREHVVMESTNASSVPVKMAPFLLRQITTMGLGGTGDVL